MSVFFSVVIPTFNRATLIAATLKSFLDQEFAGFEILVVDDGGTDNTREVVESMNDKRISYYYKENGERGAARNYGSARAEGQYITFFDSDDIVYPYYLSHAKQNLEKLNSPECYAQAFEFRNEIPVPTPPITASQPALQTINKKLEKENILACNGVFVRKDILNQYGFSEDRDLSGSEDWVLWLQLSSSFIFHYSPVVCSCLINHEQRGELNPNRKKMEKRIRLLIEILRHDQRIRQTTGSYKRILSYGYCFAALKFADFTGLKIKSIGYLIKGLVLHPLAAFYKNNFITGKKIIFSWHS
jgi:glycosyltransferase involved in cell wall biosynthesis